MGPIQICSSLDLCFFGQASGSSRDFLGADITSEAATSSLYIGRMAGTAPEGDNAYFNREMAGQEADSEL